ncbi:MAG: glycosyltransferase [Nitrospina sp.]|jgi:GT2 family glycosyltransferase|nr:glycosyltransferase [Nitrospina sp.]MBT5632157.1 glycosyltransferase [Nitrospina sp.]
MKKVSLIVVNWNGKDVLSGCLQSLLKQNYENLEIWVSDNGSEDGSQTMVRELYPSVRLLENGENLGFGSAVNRVLEKAEGHYFLFLNNDLELAPDCVVQLVDLLESDPHIGAAIPKILYHPDKQKPSLNNSAVINSFGVLINYTGIACPNLVDQQDRDGLTLTETACGGIFMFRREVYEQVGGFDEDLFLYHEDHDLSWKIRLGGWKLMVTPKSVCYHHYSFNKGVKKFYRSEKNRLHILFKNLESKTLLLIFPALIVVELAQIVHALVHGWFGLKIKSYIEILGQFPQIARKRRQIRSFRKVNDKEISRLYLGTIAVSGMRNPLMDYILSPLLNFYWKLIRGWV